jgi:hypothetical protein
MCVDSPIHVYIYIYIYIYMAETRWGKQKERKNWEVKELGN